MGAGGAGKLLAYGGKEKGARVVVANRTLGKFSSLSLFWQTSLNLNPFDF